MNILKPLQAIYYKLAFQSGLVLGGIEEEKPQWLGTSQEFNNYYKELELRNL